MPVMLVNQSNLIVLQGGGANTEREACPNQGDAMFEQIVTAAEIEEVFASLDCLNTDDAWLQSIDAALVAERLDHSLTRNQRRAVALNLMMLRSQYGPY